jgi:hypothetical protein
MTILVKNAAPINFPKATGGSETAKYFGVGTAASGAGVLLFRKALTSNLAISTNIRPQFAAEVLTITPSGDAGSNLPIEILKLLFQNDAFANVGDAGGLQPSATAGNLYISLHTADPGADGDQTTSECAYTSYARVAVARSGAGWTVVES